MDHYFIIYHDNEGYYFDELFDFHSACQTYIELTDVNDIDSEFSTCDMIKGKVISLSH